MNLLLIVVLFLFLSQGLAIANPEENFQDYLQNWDQKIKLASEYLEKAEMELKNGNEMQGCIKQRQAAKYGIEATESLIKAFKESGSNEDMTNIKNGLNKWKELRDFC